MADPPIWLTKDLVLGWKVTKGLEPQHWDQANAVRGEHKITDVVTATPKSIGHHTIIVAQSGSGKSFFLGRLLEEIALKTRSRIFILDQNSDFRKIGVTKDEKYWTHDDYRYKSKTRQGFLVDEPGPSHFAARWDKIAKRVYAGKPAVNADFKPLRLDWLKFPVDLLSEATEEEDRDQLRHCHAFVTILAELAKVKKDPLWLKAGEFLHHAYEACVATSKPIEDLAAAKLSNELAAARYGEEQILEILKRIFGDSEQRAEKGGQARSSGKHIELPRHLPTLAGIFDKRDRIALEELDLLYQRAATHRKFVLNDAVRFYFSRAVELERSGLVDADIDQTLAKPDPQRIEVVDLPSIPDGRNQKLAMCTFLEAEWQRARFEWEGALAKDAEDDVRIPTFIVVEEAHNAVPAIATTPTEKRLQEQFRRIAAEGRKYGLFLILVSQRPDKLDRMVMSECDNRAVMRVGSSFILRTTCEALGLDGVMPRMTEKVLDFEKGRALLAGAWVADEPTFLVSAARRTEEGGRDLRDKHWAAWPEEFGEMEGA